MAMTELEATDIHPRDLKAAYLMLNLWAQLLPTNEGLLKHDCISSLEDAGEWMETMGLVADIGWYFEITPKGRSLMEGECPEVNEND